MTERKDILPFGGWPSAITAEMITGGSISRDYPCKVGEKIFWQETRPREQGRTTIVMATAEGNTEDLLAPPFNVQSRVHEYGGKAWLIDGDDLFFVNRDDQRIYATTVSTPSTEPLPLTPAAQGLRFGDLCLDRDRGRLLAVCERHDPALVEPENSLVAISSDGSDATGTWLQTVANGHDFFAYPRLSPDGSRLCWITWDHPRMPWEGSVLWRARLDDAGAVEETSQVAGGPAESIFQPCWSPDNELHFVSDRSGWWNLYCQTADGDIRALCPREAEFATPLWALGMSTYGFVSNDTLATAFTQNGLWQLALLNRASGELTPVETPCAEIRGLACGADGEILFVGSTTHSASDIFAVDGASGRMRRLTDSTPALDSDTISRPVSVSFATAGGETAHGFFYPPASAAYAGPAHSKPPLILMCHGGPTGATSGVLNYKIQYWTSRGFALLDLNYRGSSGFGRAYRQKLQGAWGLVDVEDAVAGVGYLAAEGLVDPDKAIIRGSSAGGYTVLAALTFTDTFKAGASLYGIGDLEALARDTHKFESRYLDSLVGPYPEDAEEYRRRSPIHHQDRLSCPVIFLQGLEDKVVPPNQAEAMVAALDQKGIPVSYVTFADEGHGFRKSDNIKAALESELYFYRAVMAIESPEALPAIPIRNRR